MKSDLNWEKTTWNFWLAKIQYFSVSEQHETKIYDKPGGNIIEQSVDPKISRLRYLGKREGDWAYFEKSVNNQFCYSVEKNSKECCLGWVKWREDRKFLIKPDNILFTLTEADIVDTND